MDKPVLFYEVRVQRNRVDGTQIFVPAIVEREPTVPLDEIIRRAIDRGLIAGLKPSAASQVAKALAEQMYAEFQAGRGVKFGTYFSARLYLDGTTDSDGKLTDENGINVRFTNGASFKLNRNDFSMSNVAGGDIPGVDFVISDADGAERDMLLEFEGVMVNGVNLFKEGDAGTRCSFYEIDPETGAISGEAAAEVNNFTSKGPNLLTFDFPLTLEVGKRYQVVPARSADGARWFTGGGRPVEVTAAA